MTPFEQVNNVQSDRVLAWTRVGVVAVLVGLVIVNARVMQIKIDPGDELRQVMKPPVSVRTETARRGDIVDARGRVIATSLLGYRLFVDPQEVDDLQTIAADLAALIAADAVQIDRKIIKRPTSRYVVIDQLLDDWQVEAVRGAHLRGVGLEPRLVRQYPNGENAEALVGMVGFEHTGLAGAELSYDTRLGARDGRLEYVRDAHRKPLWLEPDAHAPGRHGDTIHLSIDLVIQEFAERRMSEAVEEFNAAGGRVVVLDSRTGEILALCDVIRERDDIEVFITDEMRETHPALGRNRCVTDPYEPGSTFKPFVWAVATELGLADPDEVLPTPSAPVYRTTQGRSIRDSHYYGSVDWSTVLVKSINSGMAIVAERMTHQQLRNAVERFGFGRKTHCGLPGESLGLVTPAEKWSHYTQTSVPMGHEIAVTPVQMVRAFSAFARDGSIPLLRLTAAGQSSHARDIHQQVLSPETALLTRKILRRVMREGSGRPAQSDKYEMFGKSGTAQLPNPKEGGYFEHRYVSSFIAGAPFEAPRLVALCVIDDPDRSKGHWGGSVAGPVVRDVLDDALTYLGVPGDKEPEAVALGAGH